MFGWQRILKRVIGTATRQPANEMKTTQNFAYKLRGQRTNGGKQRLRVAFELTTAVLAVLFAIMGIPANAQLVHRYSFINGATDSVGTANGTLGSGTIAGGKLTAGGTTTGVMLPPAALAGISGPFAIETWYLATAPQGADHTATASDPGFNLQSMATQIGINSGSPFGDPSLNGYTTDFRIYNQNLTAEQVTLLYAGGPPCEQRGHCGVA